jgi:hypothetical protein
MRAHRTETTPEIEFAEFLDQWGAEWRFEPRWPSDDLERADFRVWLPMLHSARWRLGRVFYVSVGCPAIAGQPVQREVPSYFVAPLQRLPDASSGTENAGFVFYDGTGKVRLRATTRANHRTGAS